MPTEPNSSDVSDPSILDPFLTPEARRPAGHMPRPDDFTDAEWVLTLNRLAADWLRGGMRSAELVLGVLDLTVQLAREFVRRHPYPCGCDGVRGIRRELQPEMEAIAATAGMASRIMASHLVHEFELTGTSGDKLRFLGEVADSVDALHGDEPDDAEGDDADQPMVVTEATTEGCQQTAAPETIAGSC